MHIYPIHRGNTLCDATLVANDALHPIRCAPITRTDRTVLPLDEPPDVSGDDAGHANHSGMGTPADKVEPKQGEGVIFLLKGDEAEKTDGGFRVEERDESDEHD